MGKINKNKILFLWLDDKEFHAVQAKKRGVDVDYVFKSISKPLKIIRRASLKLSFFPVSIWLNKLWVRKLNRFDLIIIHASKLTPLVVKYIANNNPKARVIVWYWNPVDKCVPVELFNRDKCEVWTFDESDVEKYSLHFNTQYYFGDSSIQNQKPDNDVFFVGGDKGRLTYLLEIEEKMKKSGIKTDFHITKTSNSMHKGYAYSPRINYSTVRDKIFNSKSILDVVADKQTGLTLRPLESLYFRKKLITSDSTVKSRDIYNPQNIFVLGKDDINSLQEFISSPYKKTPDNILEKYDFESWLARFFD
ncbi:hypothetical protein H5125_14645 [Shewanella sp. SR44-4]|uniref:hypothetical protein n=1 Tax=Shewanella sp. SR44-4 TaxID=2760935 RepID=UPI0016033F0F|nr:hypothetical protein [Shewanella sp. SR44-4]MBB1363382.1 hypothetical protein [Shewanella sp. SR44-4]